MSITTTLAQVGRPVAYFPRLARFLGSVHAAVLFGQLHYWQERTQDARGVHKTADELEDETGLSYREQASARKLLRDRGFLQEVHQRLQHLMWFRLDLAAIDSAFDAWVCGGAVVQADPGAADGVQAPAPGPADEGAGACNSRTTNPQFGNDESAIGERRIRNPGTAETSFDSKGIEYLQREENPPTPLAGGNGLEDEHAEALPTAVLVHGVSAEGRAEGIEGGSPAPASAAAADGEEIGAECGGVEAGQLCTMSEYLEACRAAGRHPVPDDAEVWGYAQRVGLPRELVGLAWAELRGERLADGKRRRDWPAALLAAVTRPRLWTLDDAGVYRLTGAGRQAQIFHEQRRAGRAAASAAEKTKAELAARDASWTAEHAEQARARARALAESIRSRDGRAVVRVAV